MDNYYDFIHDLSFAEEIGVVSDYFMGILSTFNFHLYKARSANMANYYDFIHDLSFAEEIGVASRLFYGNFIHLQFSFIQGTLGNHGQLCMV